MKYVQIDCVGTVCTARMGLAARDGTFVWGRESLQLVRVPIVCFLGSGLLLRGLNAFFGLSRRGEVPCTWCYFRLHDLRVGYIGILRAVIKSVHSWCEEGASEAHVLRTLHSTSGSTLGLLIEVPRVLPGSAALFGRRAKKQHCHKSHKCEAGSRPSGILSRSQ